MRRRAERLHGRAGERVSRGSVARRAQQRPLHGRDRAAPARRLEEQPAAERLRERGLRPRRTFHSRHLTRARPGIACSAPGPPERQASALRGAGARAHLHARHRRSQLLLCGTALARRVDQHLARHAGQ